MCLLAYRVTVFAWLLFLVFIIIIFCEDLGQFWEENKSETKLTANVLKQEQNTQTVKKNTDFNGTTHNHAIGGGGGGQTPFSKQQTDR